MAKELEGAKPADVKELDAFLAGFGAKEHAALRKAFKIETPYDGSIRSRVWERLRGKTAEERKAVKADLNALAKGALLEDCRAAVVEAARAWFLQPRPEKMSNAEKALIAAVEKLEGVLVLVK
jgi:hypothetical protein